MARKSELNAELDKLAMLISQQAAQDATPLMERLDAFKALTTYYSAQNRARKGKASDDDETSDGFDFNQGIPALHGGANGGSAAPVRGRRPT